MDASNGYWPLGIFAAKAVPGRAHPFNYKHSPATTGPARPLATTEGRIRAAGGVCGLHLLRLSLYSRRRHYLTKNNQTNESSYLLYGVCNHRLPDEHSTRHHYLSCTKSVPASNTRVSGEGLRLYTYEHVSVEHSGDEVHETRVVAIRALQRRHTTTQCNAFCTNERV